MENFDWWYKGENPQFWYAQNLQIGDIAYDSFGKQVAEVKNIENYDLGEDGRKIYIDLKVRANFDKKRQQYIYEFKPLLVGSSVIFNFGQEQLRGLVVALNEDSLINDFSKQAPEEYKKIRVRINFILPELAEKVTIGSSIVDGFGQPVAEVINVEKEIAKYHEFSDIRAQKILIQDPEYRLLLIDLKIKVTKSFNEFYYVDGTAIKIGQLFDLNFTDFVLSNVEIIAIE